MKNGKKTPMHLFYGEVLLRFDQHIFSLFLRNKIQFESYRKVFRDFNWHLEKFIEVDLLTFYNIFDVCGIFHCQAFSLSLSFDLVKSLLCLVENNQRFKASSMSHIIFPCSVAFSPSKTITMKHLEIQKFCNIIVLCKVMPSHLKCV